VRQEEECAAPPSQLYHGGSSIVFEGSHHLQCVHERGCVWTCCMNVCLSIPCPDTFPVLFHFPATGLVCSRWPPTLGSSPLPDVRNLQLTSQLQQLLVSPYQCLRRQWGGAGRAWNWQIFWFQCIYGKNKKKRLRATTLGHPMGETEILKSITLA
jgi:hypothetical protein